MPPRKKPASKARKPGAAQPAGAERLDEALTWLKRHASKATRDGMARYAIPSDTALGVTVANIRVLAKRLGRDHDLAVALWGTGVYEARMLVAFVGDPSRVTPAQMDRWCKDFDNWAICDTLCFHLFDRTPHAFDKVHAWCDRRAEFEKRAAFALLASVALHDKQAGDAAFAKSLPLIERAAGDDRNFVKKAVNWALRAIGKRNPALNRAASEVAQRLAASTDASARWVGKDALRELSKTPRTRKSK